MCLLIIWCDVPFSRSHFLLLVIWCFSCVISLVVYLFIFILGLKPSRSTFSFSLISGYSLYWVLFWSSILCPSFNKISYWSLIGFLEINTFILWSKHGKEKNEEHCHNWYHRICLGFHEMPPFQIFYCHLSQWPWSCDSPT